jgi:hypothetical protein
MNYMYPKKIITIVTILMFSWKFEINRKEIYFATAVF